MHAHVHVHVHAQSIASPGLSGYLSLFLPAAAVRGPDVRHAPGVISLATQLCRGVVWCGFRKVYILIFVVAAR